MKVPIIRIGNSKGIILSKTLRERYDFKGKLEIVMKQNHLELRQVSTPRKDWDIKFKQMHDEGDDRILIDDLIMDEDLEEWK